ncbi:CPBP family intramembrane glutamic endopeptidase [Gilvimarinus xylanilyticus]|uniref:CPBP family intramembrane metalloprotease n=1 Tax=Gilvimarinus xylanilyticus TaxID=2944139 RepID=A0A9X2KTW6_9GAMM|nr:CPBP family intramembrane glutamic endopeptidase [Gilvimarinus xylanilyticus]MCP8899622.1 CPBP family intramembrane metalloprotease [Gilvimarinus xylanilyticus]
MSFELGLGLLGLAGLMWAGIQILPLSPDWVNSALGGTSAAAATYLTWLVVMRIFPTLQRELLPSLEQFRALFARSKLWQISLISAAAGVGEELLFRGFIQSFASQHWGTGYAIAIASLIFAAGHALSLTYFMITLVMGLAFGWVYAQNGDLLLLMVWHGVYDFIAITVILHRPRWLLAGYLWQGPSEPAIKTDTDPRGTNEKTRQ